MGNVIQIDQFRRAPMKTEPTKIIKIIDGKPVECIDVDSLSSADRKRYFSGEFANTPRSKPRGAPGV